MFLFDGLRHTGLLLCALAVVHAKGVAAAAAAEVELLMQTCLACHSADATPPDPEAPIIAGQPFTAINDALMLFADGERPCTAMCALAAALSPDEREALANELELQPYVPARQEFDPAMALLGAKLHRDKACDTCHSRGGWNGSGGVPILAGQRTPYLRNALQQIRAGTRSGPAVMNREVRSLSDDEIEALLNYYARDPDWRGAREILPESEITGKKNGRKN